LFGNEEARRGALDGRMMAGKTTIIKRLEPYGGQIRFVVTVYSNCGYQLTSTLNFLAIPNRAARSQCTSLMPK
jgi:hypothetical protein